MSYSTRDRDRYRIAVAAVTGVSTVGALTATGWLMGMAADDFAEQQSADAAQSGTPASQQQRGDRRQARTTPRQPRQRPHVTRVTVRYVTSTSTTHPVGAGGTVAPVPSDSSGSGTSGSSGSGSSGSGSSGSGSSGSGSSGGSSSGPGPAPAPPPPPPPPAPSSGS